LLPAHQEAEKAKRRVMPEPFRHLPSRLPNSIYLPKTAIQKTPKRLARTNLAAGSTLSVEPEHAERLSGCQSGCWERSPGVRYDPAPRGAPLVSSLLQLIVIETVSYSMLVDAARAQSSWREPVRFGCHLKPSSWEVRNWDVRGDSLASTGWIAT
jgi:hypothetical protein